MIQTINDATKSAWATALEHELLSNILPFWLEHTRDPKGGFYGAISNDLRIHNEVGRSAVLCSRILWTFSAAYRCYPRPEYLQMAHHAYGALKQSFWDYEYGGVYWMVGADGSTLEDRKHSYAQGFAIYGLSEYYRVTRDLEALSRAIELFELLEQNAFDPLHGGYFEGCARDWTALQDSRLSPKEPAALKSMNTLLHLLEPFTNLLEVWPNALLHERLLQLTELFLDKVFDPQTHRFQLFFDREWNAQGDAVSYGHDIEAGWLVLRAAQVLGDEALLTKAKAVSLLVAEAVFKSGRDADGSVFYEGNLAGVYAFEKHWWVQAEAMVGFYDAFQTSSDPRWADAASACWQFIDRHMIDRTNGDWFKLTSREGQPYQDHFKAGPWECPYHHARACLEMVQRLRN